MFHLKLHCGNEISTLVLRACPSYEALTTMLHNLFGLADIHIDYEDEERDTITITSQMELNEGRKLVVYQSEY
jgi:hypothetical protein